MAVRRLAETDPGLNQSEIARLLSVSRERVRQIVAQDGLAVARGKKGTGSAWLQGRRLPLGQTLAASTDRVFAGNSYVYALVDAADPERVRYVGSTVSPPSRLAAHIRQPQGKLVAEWVRGMLAAGGCILMRHLAHSSDRQGAFDTEAAQLHHYRTIGMADLNGPHTRPEVSAVRKQ